MKQWCTQGGLSFASVIVNQHQFNIANPSLADKNNLHKIVHSPNIDKSSLPRPGNEANKDSQTHSRQLTLFEVWSYIYLSQRLVWHSPGLPDLPHHPRCTCTRVALCVWANTQCHKLLSHIAYLARAGKGTEKDTICPLGHSSTAVSFSPFFLPPSPSRSLWSESETNTPWGEQRSLGQEETK